MSPRALLACTLLACCLVAARGEVPDDDQHPNDSSLISNYRRLLLTNLDLKQWRMGAITVARVLGCTDEGEGGPCLTVDEVVDAVHNKVVNLTVVAIESELPDKRLDAWLGAELAIFFSGAANISLAFDDLLAARADDDVHAAVSKVDFCPLAHGNMLNITVRLEGETAFGGMPVRDDLMSGTTVDVLVGHHDEMQERGHEARLTALLGNSAT